MRRGFLSWLIFLLLLCVDLLTRLCCWSGVVSVGFCLVFYVCFVSLLLVLLFLFLLRLAWFFRRPSFVTGRSSGVWYGFTWQLLFLWSYSPLLHTEHACSCFLLLRCCCCCCCCRRRRRRSEAVIVLLDGCYCSSAVCMRDARSHPCPAARPILASGTVRRGERFESADQGGFEPLTPTHRTRIA